MASIENYPDSRKVKDAIQEDIKGDLNELNAEVAAISAGSGVLVSSNDTTVGYLNGKLTAGNGVTLTEGSDGGNETLAIRAELSLVANAAALGTGNVDGEMRITVDDANRYTWDDTNSKWRIMTGGIFSSDPSSVTYTIPTGTLVYNTTDVQLKRYTGTEWVNYNARSYAAVSHTVATGSDGGDTVADTWNVRPITTEDTDADSILSISSNQITPVAGTYEVSGWSVAYDCSYNQAALYNATSSSYLILGSTRFTSRSYDGESISTFEDRITVAAGQALEVHHYSKNAKTGGLGRDAGSGQNNIFAKVIFKKVG